MSNCSSELQERLDFLFDYCHRWKLVVNTGNIMIFRKGGRLLQ